jgi:hypothetical protein
MLAQEFWALNPKPSDSRLLDGTLCHKTVNSPASVHDSLSVDRIDPPPVKIQEDGGRGTSINSSADQASLFRYWAWARQSIAVGIGLAIDNHTVEYWPSFTLNPVPDDDEGRVYPEILRQLWLSEIAMRSPRIAIESDNLGQNFSYRMRYQGNA